MLGAPMLSGILGVLCFSVSSAQVPCQVGPYVLRWAWRGCASAEARGICAEGPGVAEHGAPNREGSCPLFSRGESPLALLCRAGPARWSWPCQEHLGETRSQKCLLGQDCGTFQVMEKA